ncbi:LysR family transcriptional regulator, partial [Pseudomonas congelans]
SVIWRKQTFPGVLPSYRCSNMSAVSQLVAAGLGVAALTGFTVEGLGAVERLSGPLEGCRTDLWLLTRPDCRALRSVQTLLEALAPRLRAALQVSNPD